MVSPHQLSKAEAHTCVKGEAVEDGAKRDVIILCMHVQPTACLRRHVLAT